MHSKNKEVTFIILQKNMRSMHSSEKIEELVTELEGYRWDAILLSETWRHEPAEIWETHYKHIFMGAVREQTRKGLTNKNKSTCKSRVKQTTHNGWSEKLIDSSRLEISDARHRGKMTVDVERPSALASAIVDEGFRVVSVLTESDNQHVSAGRKIPMCRKNGVFVLSGGRSTEHEAVEDGDVCHV